jgi:hypothetical protein
VVKKECFQPTSPGQSRPSLTLSPATTLTICGATPTTLKQWIDNQLLLKLNFIQCDIQYNICSVNGVLFLQYTCSCVLFVLYTCICVLSCSTDLLVDSSTVESKCVLFTVQSDLCTTVLNYVWILNLFYLQYIICATSSTEWPVYCWTVQCEKCGVLLSKVQCTVKCTVALYLEVHWNVQWYLTPSANQSSTGWKFWKFHKVASPNLWNLGQFRTHGQSIIAAETRNNFKLANSSKKIYA